jgi:hypothetical protein
MAGWLSEPLLHFLLIGLVLFGLDAALAGSGSATAHRIVVDDAVRTRLSEGFERATGRSPTAQELDGQVEKWLDEEVLYREGLARELDRDDGRVRRRIADKMSFVVESSLDLPEPSDAELKNWFSQHRERWSEPERVSFSHVFVSGKAAPARTRAQQLLSQLQAGAQPHGLGDRFSGGRRYRQRKLSSLESAFGAEFAQAVRALRKDQWQLTPSRHGWHVLRVDERLAAKPAAFEDVKADVARDYRAEQRAQRTQKAIRRLRDNWQIVHSP